MLSLDGGEPVAAIRRLEHPVSLITQKRREEVPVAREVVNDQDRRHAQPPWPMRYRGVCATRMCGTSSAVPEATSVDILQSPALLQSNTVQLLRRMHASAGH